ncbi:MAG TPA: hypothetical protein VNO83_17375 [Pseudonocardia sp.]|nr:hypothetical protein [Pseudonocardia sp.]
MGVEVLKVFLKHRPGVARSGAQKVVTAFAAPYADEARGDRVRSRRSNPRADDADVGAGERRIEGGQVGPGPQASDFEAGAPQNPPVG